MHTPVAFSQNAYQPKYLANLKRLMDFDEKTKEANIVPRLQKHMLKMARYVLFVSNFTQISSSMIFICRKHARVDVTANLKPSELLDADIEAAKKEWETLILSEDEESDLE